VAGFTRNGGNLFPEWVAGLPRILHDNNAVTVCICKSKSPAFKHGLKLTPAFKAEGKQRDTTPPKHPEGAGQVERLRAGCPKEWSAAVSSKDAVNGQHCQCCPCLRCLPLSPPNLAKRKNAEWHFFTT